MLYWLCIITSDTVLDKCITLDNIFDCSEYDFKEYDEDPLINPFNDEKAKLNAAQGLSDSPIKYALVITYQHLEDAYQNVS